MRLEHLFDGEAWYAEEGAWVYRQPEAAGYAGGEGKLWGERLEGLLRWSNSPHRRADGVWVADMRGFIETGDGARILVEMGGRSLPEEAPGLRRDLVCWLSAQTDDDRYRWLNDLVGVVEARVDPRTTWMTLRAWACMNELPPGDGPGES
ncbi:MAG: hypothetical protein HY775_02735 [Acidobacteria bacterium]|nr:hypothetical protein [Acidobacteriota bacterium]